MFGQNGQTCLANRQISAEDSVTFLPTCSGLGRSLHTTYIPTYTIVCNYVVYLLIGCVKIVYFIVLGLLYLRFLPGLAWISLYEKPRQIMNPTGFFKGSILWEFLVQISPFYSQLQSTKLGHSLLFSITKRRKYKERPQTTPLSCIHRHIVVASHISSSTDSTTRSNS